VNADVRAELRRNEAREESTEMAIEANTACKDQRLYHQGECLDLFMLYTTKSMQTTQNELKTRTNSVQETANNTLLCTDEEKYRHLVQDVFQQVRYKFGTSAMVQVGSFDRLLMCYCKHLTSRK
jgi:hypothetical protein